MQGLQNRNLTTLLIAVLGALKLILQAFGVDVITSQQVDAIANGLAALITVAGVVMTHMKKSASSSSPPAAPNADAKTSQPPPTITHSARAESVSVDSVLGDSVPDSTGNPVSDSLTSSSPVSR